MTEYYAKIVPIEKGMFCYHAVIWKSHNGIESIFNDKKFFKINSAKKWSEKIITSSVVKESKIIFIKESNILRRKWNE